MVSAPARELPMDVLGGARIAEYCAAELTRSSVAGENGMRLLEKVISRPAGPSPGVTSHPPRRRRARKRITGSSKSSNCRYKAGLASARDVMEAEAELRYAQSRELEDRLQLVLASILLSRQDGSILERRFRRVLSATAARKWYLWCTNVWEGLPELRKHSGLIVRIPIGWRPMGIYSNGSGDIEQSDGKTGAKACRDE
jgi:hypothetical protein